jgi:urate oxidase / 2-oxo-4-hydroxy-4-carboxy-5-ureidoimidazoline decarboxylase
MANLLEHRYGKHAVSVYRTDGERLFACEVDLMVVGEAFAASYTEGDNSLVVATDSMKNFVHRAALDYAEESLEDFLVGIAGRFLERYEHVEAIDLQARELPFARRSGVVLQRLYDDHAVAGLALTRTGERQEWSGRRALHLVKLAGSSFAGFVRDEYTTLPESHDRPLFVHLNVHWINSDHARRAPSEEVRELLVETFADFDSASIQHLVHEMGVRALERFDQLATIRFEAENRLWDTAQETEGTRVYTDARPPYGLIELTLQR